MTVREFIHMLMECDLDKEVVILHQRRNGKELAYKPEVVSSFAHLEDDGSGTCDDNGEKVYMPRIVGDFVAIR